MESPQRKGSFGNISRTLFDGEMWCICRCDLLVRFCCQGLQRWERGLATESRETPSFGAFAFRSKIKNISNFEKYFMAKSYYLFNPGRMSRRDNTLKFEAVAENGQKQAAKYLPIEGVEDLYVFGSVDANSALYAFLGKQGVSVHFFDYYEHYRGSFMPKEYLLAGKVQVEQTKLYLNKKKRLFLAQSIVEGAAFNMCKNLRYYDKRGKDLEEPILRIEGYVQSILKVNDVNELMGIEGNIRQAYYSGFNEILSEFSFNGRNRQPPRDPINALISFGNMMCYTTCLGQIYHTQLNPTIGFLHEPGMRRYTLSLDLAEIFKPILVDRLIFKMVNKKMLDVSDFDSSVNHCTLKDKGRKAFIKQYDEKLKDTIHHRTLDKKVSYKRLIRLECYKMIKHVLGMNEYRPFKIYW